MAFRDWQCMECGRKMTLRQAERGCSGCGSTDVDVAAGTFRMTTPERPEQPRRDKDPEFLSW